MQTQRQHATAPAWFQHTHADAPLTAVAYFSMEFMLSEALPIYSGGLGNVAGDQLKAASDLGVPVVGVGLLYQQGYFRQVIDRDGAQQALYPYQRSRRSCPITPLREPNGEWLRLEVALPGCSVWLRAWQVQVGRTQLYLLDSNDPANLPTHRGITSELYGGGPELRLQAGAGAGYRRLAPAAQRWASSRRSAISTRDMPPSPCWSGPATSWSETGQPFEVALAVTRAGNLFTTHTAVEPASTGSRPALIEQYLGAYAREQLGITHHDLLGLGPRRIRNDAAEPFNMAYLAVRGSGAVNGVSRLHGSVSRRLFQPLFPRWPQDEVPVGHVTNGVHMPTLGLGGGR